MGLQTQHYNQKKGKKMNKVIYLIVLIFSTLSCTKDSYIGFELDNSVISRSNYTISGKVFWSKDLSTGVGNVVVTLNGPESASFTTLSDGIYEFNVTTPGIYTITPQKLTNVMSGVTIADCSLLQQFIINGYPITQYQLCAADINNNMLATSGDLSIIYQAILGNPVALNLMNTSWKFADKSYIFPSYHPIPAYPQSINVDVNSNVWNVDFVGFKMGDVNNSTNPSL